MKYLKVFTDFAQSLELLGDAECGRLFKAMLKYAQTGQEPDLRGNERFIWPTAKQSIDRDGETYRRKVDAALKATEKRNRTITYDNVRQRTITYDNAQDKDKDKDKEEEVVRAREAPAAAGWMSADEMDQAADEYNRLMDAMEAIGMPTTVYNTEQVMALKAQYGTDKVLEALKTAAEGDTKGGVSLAFVRAILEGGPKQQPAKKQAVRTIRECCVIDGKEVWTERKVAAP